VASGSVPVGEEFGSERNANVEVFGDSVEEIASYPQVVTNRNTFARAYLEFPLPWHNLSVGARNVDSSVEASFVVHVSNYTAEADVGTD